MKEKERAAVVTEYLYAIRNANDVIVANHTAMCMQHLTSFQFNQKVFMTKTNQLNQVALFCLCTQ